MLLMLDLRITLNRRLATAAPAMVHRMTNRKRLLVFWAEVPSRNGFPVSLCMMEAVAVVMARLLRESTKSQIGLTLEMVKPWAASLSGLVPAVN